MRSGRTRSGEGGRCAAYSLAEALRELEEILRRVEEKRVRVNRIPERWELL